MADEPKYQGAYPQLVTKIIASYVSHHNVAPEQIPELISSVHRTFDSLARPSETAGRADAGRPAAALGAARRGRVPRMRLERQDAPPPSEHPPWADRRAVPEAMEFADGTPADRAELFRAALQPRQGAGPRPRRPAGVSAAARIRTRAAAPTTRPPASRGSGAARRGIDADEADQRRRVPASVTIASIGTSKLCGWIVSSDLELEADADRQRPRRQARQRPVEIAAAIAEPIAGAIEADERREHERRHDDLALFRDRDVPDAVDERLAGPPGAVFERAFLVDDDRQRDRAPGTRPPSRSAAADRTRRETASTRREYREPSQ